MSVRAFSVPMGSHLARSPIAGWLGSLLVPLVSLLGVPGCNHASDLPASEGPARARIDADTGRGYEIPRLPPEKLRLSGAAEGMDGLLRTVERALAERDSTRLEDLMVTAQEFRDILFPSFPAAHPPINADFETVWLLQASDSRRGLRRLLRDYGGKKVRILAIRFENPHQDFVNFVLDETSRVDLEVDGERRENVKLFGSVFHIGEQYKLLSYPDD
jgi:hypothetical protein